MHEFLVLRIARYIFFEIVWKSRISKFFKYILNDSYDEPDKRDKRCMILAAIYLFFTFLYLIKYDCLFLSIIFPFLIAVPIVIYICLIGIFVEGLIGLLIAIFCYKIKKPTPKYFRFVHKKEKENPQLKDGSFKFSQLEIEEIEDRQIDKYFEEEFPQNRWKVCQSEFF